MPNPNNLKFDEYFKTALSSEEVSRFTALGCLEEIRVIMACAWFDGRLELLREQISKRAEQQPSSLASLI